MIVGPLSQFVNDYSIRWLVNGGLLYSVGFCFFINTSLPYQHAIWHMFVLAAAAAHYRGVVHGITTVLSRNVEPQWLVDA